MMMKYSIAGLVGLLAASTSEAEFVAKLTSLSKYPGYTGERDVKVVGDQVWITYSGDSVMAKGKLSGLTASGSGGFHIHAGSSCEDGVPGPHYWEGTGGDPWTTTWESDADGNADLDIAAKPYGDLDQKSTGGRVVVIHDTKENGGTRIACGKLVDASSMDFAAGTLSPYVGFDTTVARGKLAKYPGYNGDVTVTGTFTLTPENVFTATITAAENTGPGGIHIHSGVTCDADELVDGHHWNSTGNSTEDPWNEIKWELVGEDYVVDLNDLNYTLAFEDNVNRVVVVHADNGTKVACGQLVYTPKPEGYVKAYETDGKLVVEGWAQGLQPIDGEVGGAHVHAGESCQNSLGHLMDPADDKVDPWKDHKYTVAVTTQTELNGKERQTERTYFKFEVPSTASVNLAAITGKPYVLHDGNGNRILCGSLAAVAGEEIPTGAPTVSPTVSPTGSPITGSPTKSPTADESGASTTAMASFVFALVFALLF